MKKKKLRKRIEEMSVIIGDLAEENLAFGKENSILIDDLRATRSSHGRLCRGIKDALGIRNWPDMDGVFVDGVIRLLHEWADDLKEKADGSEVSGPGGEQELREEVGSGSCGCRSTG